MKNTICTLGLRKLQMKGLGFYCQGCRYQLPEDVRGFTRGSRDMGIIAGIVFRVIRAVV